MDGPTIRILLIEDNPGDVALIRAYLAEAEGVRFELAHMGLLSAGLEWLEAGQADVVLTDLSLPDSSGLDTFRQIRERCSDIPILVLTGAEVMEIAIQAVREGAAEYLFKGQLHGNGALLLRSIRYAIERKQGEKALRESEQHYRQLLAAVTSYTYSVKLQNDVPISTEHGAGCQRVTGYAPEDYASDPYRWFSMIHAEDRAMVQQHVARILAREEVPPIEHRLRHRDGTTRWVRDTIVCHCDDTGQLVGYDGLVEDITERKQAEVQLRYHRDFAESVVRMVQALVFLLDVQGKILRFNHYAGEVSGHALCDALSKDFFTMFIPESDRPDIRALFTQVLQAHDAFVSTHPLTTKNGMRRIVQWRGKAVRDPEDNVLFVLFTGHDVTSLKEAQQRALQSERLAAIGQMIMGLAHESRNALQRSQGCLALLARVVKDEPRALDYIARVQDAQDHLDHILGKVREYASPIILEHRVCHLGELLQETWANLTSVRDTGEARLRTNDSATALDCEVDRFRIVQVFRNILENAISAGGDPVEVEVEPSEVELDGRPAVRIAIRDNGSGLTAEQIERIFEPFYTTKTHGTGLGMAIAKRFVEAHGGQIEVGPGLGHGAEFLVTLPRRRMDHLSGDGTDVNLLDRQRL